MEELSKTQIVLLTLLVSFVTSIATGIVTVALVDQSSQGVGQTIQTVIQRTIETVAGTSTADKIVTVKPTPTTTTPTPSENDLTIQAIAKNSAALVRIKKLGGSADQSFVGLGVIIDKNGTVLTDHGLLGTATTYVGVLYDGRVATLTASTINTSAKEAGVFTLALPPGTAFGVTTLGNSDNLSLGQKVISISGADKDVIQVGLIDSFDKDGGNSKGFIETDFDSTNKAYGSILVNLSGEVVGMKTSASTNAGAPYQAINSLKNDIK